jgi:hypothetical protein
MATKASYMLWLKAISFLALGKITATRNGPATGASVAKTGASVAAGASVATEGASVGAAAVGAAGEPHALMMSAKARTTANNQVYFFIFFFS